MMDLLRWRGPALPVAVMTQRIVCPESLGQYSPFVVIPPLLLLVPWLAFAFVAWHFVRYLSAPA